MKFLGKVTQGKGETKQKQDQNVFHALTSIPKGQAKSILDPDLCYHAGPSLLNHPLISNARER